MGELNQRLRAEFLEFRLDRMDDGVIGVVPVLRERPSLTLTVSYDEAMASPLPSYDDYLRMQREAAREDPLWVTGEEQIQPPTKLLKIPDGKDRHSQR